MQSETDDSIEELFSVARERAVRGSEAAQSVAAALADGCRPNGAELQSIEEAVNAIEDLHAALVGSGYEIPADTCLENWSRNWRRERKLGRLRALDGPAPLMELLFQHVDVLDNAAVDSVLELEALVAENPGDLETMRDALDLAHRLMPEAPRTVPLAIVRGELHCRTVSSPPVGGRDAATGSVIAPGRMEQVDGTARGIDLDSEPLHTGVGGDSGRRVPADDDCSGTDGACVADSEADLDLVDAETLWAGPDHPIRLRHIQRDMRPPIEWRDAPADDRDWQGP